MKLVGVCIIMLLGLTRVNGQINFYVSPKGNDNNVGTQAHPLASLMGARDAVRNYKNNHTEKDSIVVLIEEGIYEMKEPFVLTPQDSGTDANPIVYRAVKGSHPVFSGGKKITGFKVKSEDLWETDVFESSYYKWRFDQLYVNGERATLARTPNRGFLTIEGVKEHVWERGYGRAPEKAQQVLYFDSINFNPISQISDEELDNVRFRVYHKWDFTLRFIDKLERDSLKVYTSGQGMKPWNPLAKGNRISFENFRAALDAPGEWFLNDKGTLYYMPRPGETIENTEIIAPVLESLMYVEGDATKNRFVEHIRIEGLGFQYCSYRMPRSGSEPNQAAAKVSAAISLKGARNIEFYDCEISKTGQHALWFEKGCSDSTVEHCYLNDLGGGGIYLGDFEPLEGVEHTHNIQLNNNIIQSGGKEFPSAVGIWVGHSSDNEITHNDIGDFYYTGISVGWIWGYASSLAKNNKIVFNNIHHIGWDLLSDMAAVYTLGPSEGTVINNNVIHHVHAYSYGGWGLYTDEGSSGITMENNLVYNTKTGGFHQHYGKNNIIKNNIFAFAKQYQVQCTRVENHRSFDFSNNIIIFDEGVVLKGAWNNIDIQMDKNMYWNIKEVHYDFNGNTFSEWRKRSGHDQQSIIANPNFEDARNFNFIFKNKRNSKRIGFKPFDYSKAGVYGAVTWKDKAKLSKNILNKFDKVVEANMKNNH